jgi:hypothetical protein
VPSNDPGKRAKQTARLLVLVVRLDDFLLTVAEIARDNPLPCQEMNASFMRYFPHSFVGGYHTVMHGPDAGSNVHINNGGCPRKRDNAITPTSKTSTSSATLLYIIICCVFHPAHEV